jgi:hypothetical protein
MTSITATSSTTEARLFPLALGTFAGTTAFTALGTFVDGTDGAEHSTGDFLVIAGLTAVAVAVVFGLVVPRARAGSRAAGVGLGLSIAGMVLVLAFWSGLTPALAVGGMVLGAGVRRSGRGTGAGAAAIAVGALALLGYVAIYVLDWMATNNIAGM